MYHLHQLFTQTDRVSLRYEYHAIESISNDEDRELAGICQFHG